MLGYWQRPDETARVLKDGWLATGDVATIDDDGYLYIVDRKKDMILVSGFNVYPNEVEAVLAAHPGVAEVAVIGMPDETSARPCAPSWSGATRRSPTEDCATTAAQSLTPTRCRGRRASATICRSRRWARCCARTCGTCAAAPRADRPPAMDPVCHSLAGLALGQAGLGGARRWPCRRSCWRPTRPTSTSRC